MKLITKKNENNDEMLIVFVGGLAANQEILSRVKKMVAELKRDFSSASEP